MGELRFLKFVESSEQFQEECSFSIGRNAICEIVDLTIFQLDDLLLQLLQRTVKKVQQHLHLLSFQSKLLAKLLFLSRSQVYCA
jgi:hypothetical protein